MKHKIQEVRKIKGIKQIELAEKLGITRQGVSSIENSDSVTLNTLEKVANALSCSVFDLIDKDSFESASDSEKAEISNMAFDDANAKINRASNICELAGYLWKWDNAKDGLIHLIDKKTKAEYAVTDELFTAAVDGSLDYIEYNFEKLIKSAKVVDNGK